MECFPYPLRFATRTGERPGQGTGFQLEYSQCIGKSPLLSVLLRGNMHWVGTDSINGTIFPVIHSYCLNTTVPPPDCFWLTTYKPNNVISVSGGMRYDYGYIHISSHEDAYLADYLRKQGYDEEQVEHYKWNSHAVKKKFGDYSFSLGLVWTPSERYMVKANVGRSFRLPGANELAANGVHHGTFRHEQGDANLKSEQGWQMDASYNLRYNGFSISVSPFFSWFSNYIFLRPTGEWSVLPHAGQIYRYTGAEVLFAGTEATIDIHFLRSFNYRISGEYVYTYNCDEHIPLSFSPPFSMRNTLTWQRKQVMLLCRVAVHSPAKSRRS